MMYHKSKMVDVRGLKIQQLAATDPSPGLHMLFRGSRYFITKDLGLKDRACHGSWDT